MESNFVSLHEKEERMRRFQDEVRSALLKYALVPGLLIAFICTVLAALYWERNVVARTAEEARAAGSLRS